MSSESYNAWTPRWDDEKFSDSGSGSPVKIKSLSPKKKDTTKGTLDGWLGLSPTQKTTTAIASKLQTGTPPMEQVSSAVSHAITDYFITTSPKIKAELIDASAADGIEKSMSAKAQVVSEASDEKETDTTSDEASKATTTKPTPIEGTADDAIDITAAISSIALPKATDKKLITTTMKTTTVATKSFAPTVGKRMELKALEKLCRHSQSMWETHSLNDVLYFHSQGFNEIGEAIGRYKNVCTLYLQNNIICKLENLHSLKHLRSLFLQNNCLSEMSGVECLSSLRELDLSQNSIARISGVGALKQLRTLNLSANLINAVESTLDLIQCPSLITLDLSNNRIPHNAECDLVKDVLAMVLTLKTLYLRGNPLVTGMDHYRRTVVSSLKGLTYLDLRPVDAKERRLHEAWANGDEAEVRRVMEAMESKEEMARKAKKHAALERYKKRASAMLRRMLNESPPRSDESLLMNELSSEDDDDDCVSDSYASGGGVKKYSLSASLREVAIGSVEVTAPPSDDELPQLETATASGGFFEGMHGSCDRSSRSVETETVSSTPSAGMDADDAYNLHAYVIGDEPLLLPGAVISGGADI